jgi:hypothetical protein
MLDTALGERFYKDSQALEEQYTNELVESIRRAIAGHFEEGRRPAHRDAHAFDNGCVRAIFQVDENLREELRVGVFEPGSQYKTWIRFSNGNSEPRPGWMFDARGMAIKLTGVPGEKLIDDEKHTQDFILISNPKFFVDDLIRYRKTLEWFLRGGLLDQYLISLLQLRWLTEAPKAFKANWNFMSNPLHQQYWSMVPYRFGIDPARKFAVKYMARPRLHDRPGLLSRHLTRLGWNFSPKEEMNKTLAGNEVWFDFYIQPFVDATRTPIEDSKVEWTEAVSRPEHIAKIIIPIQDCTSPQQAVFCENLSFSPWHGLPEHMPLGLVNRVRKIAYSEISKLRHDLNDTPRQEPTGDENFETRG